MNSARRFVLGPLFSAVFCLAAPARAAEPFPGLREMLETEDECEFVVAFASFLEKLPKERCPEFGKVVRDGWKNGELSQRHRNRVADLFYQREAEADPAGWLADIKPGQACDSDLAVYCLRALFARDREAALEVFRRLAKDRSQYWVPKKFCAWLAKSDPALALRELKALPSSPSGIAPMAEDLFEVWAASDPKAAWEAAKGLPKPAVEDGRIMSIRTSIFTRQYLLDPSLALTWWREITDETFRINMIQNSVYRLNRDAPEVARALAEKMDLPAVWESFGLSIRRETPDAELRELLEKVPLAMRERALAGYFEVTSFGVTSPGLKRLVLLTELRDVPLRSRLLAKACSSCCTNGASIPLPGDLRKSLMARPAREVLAEMGSDAPLLVAAMMTGDPRGILPWLLALDDEGWNKFREILATAWSPFLLADDATVLFDSANPREAALGRRLAERWFEADCFAAAPLWHRKDMSWLLERPQVDRMLEQCRGSADRARGYAAAFPEGAGRDGVSAAVTRWQRAREEKARSGRADTVAPIAEAAQPDFAKLVAALRPLVNSTRPEIDGWIGKIPDDTPGADALRADRGRWHLRWGRPGSACAMWRRVADDGLLDKALHDLPQRFGACVDLTEVWDLLAARPEGAARDKAMISLCGVVAGGSRAKAVAMAEKSPSRDVRAKVGAMVADGARTVADFDALRHLIGDDAAGTEESNLNYHAAREAPAWLWRDFARRGNRGSKHRAQLEEAFARMFARDPVAAVGLAWECPAQAAQCPAVLATLSGVPARWWPRRTYQLLDRLLPADHDMRAKVIGVCLRAWLKRDKRGLLREMAGDERLFARIAGNSELMEQLGAESMLEAFLRLPVGRIIPGIASEFARTLGNTDYRAGVAVLKMAYVRGFCAGVPESELRKMITTLDSLARNWHMSDPENALACLNLNPGDVAIVRDMAVFPSETAWKQHREIQRLAEMAAAGEVVPVLDGIAALDAPGNMTLNTHPVLSGLVSGLLERNDRCGLRLFQIWTREHSRMQAGRLLGPPVFTWLVGQPRDQALAWLKSLDPRGDEVLLEQIMLAPADALAGSTGRRLALEAGRVLAEIRSPKDAGAPPRHEAWEWLFYPKNAAAFPYAVTHAAFGDADGTAPVQSRLDGVIAALAARRPAAALAPASELPSPEFDPLLCNILRAIPADRLDAAIATTPEMQRDRLRAWSSALGIRK